MAEAAWEEANRPRGWGGWFAVPSDTDSSAKILIIIIYIVYANVSHYLFICYFFKKCKNLKK